jgi:NAD(P)H-dependent FMN reductase
MRILIVSGSRNPEGRTAGLIKALRRGIARAGGDSECLFLPHMEIERCRQCNDDGWGICLSEKRCIIVEDDFTSVVEKINVSDAVVFATPVYYNDLSESMKAFLDRLRRTRTGILTPSTSNIPRPFNPEEGTLALGMCYAGGSGNGATFCCMNLERILQFCGFDVVDMIPVRRQNMEAKLPMLELVGEWLVTKPSSFKCELEPV